MHKDQTRIQELVLPTIAARVVDTSPEAERDCTVLNRLLSQGPDPMYLMEACPEVFRDLCKGLHLTIEEGREAIEKAHWQGPGALLEGTGIPLEEDPNMALDMKAVPLAFRQEMLWLLMAGVSDVTEGGYKDETPLLDRIRFAHRAAGRMADLITTFSELTPCLISEAYNILEDFVDDTPYTMVDGFPHTHVDHGFYVLFKSGHKVVACHDPSGNIFWGTVPGTTLAEQGITVDKEISPSFGIVFVE